MNCLVSIIVPCYNQADYLDAALQAVMDQTHQNWECLIVNDGSLDKTEEVAKKWVAKDSRFIYLYKENGGVSSARNFGIEKSKGHYLQFLDSDDYLDKQKLELSLEQIKTNSDANLVISNFRMFTTNPEKTTKPFCVLTASLFTFENMLFQWNERFSIQVQCGFFHYSLFETIRFPEDISAQEDWIVWVRVFKNGCKVVFIDKALALYRINPLSRMTTKGLSDDHLKACSYFRSFLSEQEYSTFSTVLLSRYYNLYIDYKYRFASTKNSNSYQVGLMIKKTLKSLGLLNLSKRLFPSILKFKSK